MSAAAQRLTTSSEYDPHTGLTICLECNELTGNWWAYYEGYRDTSMNGFGNFKGAAISMLQDLWENKILQMEADRILAGQAPLNLLPGKPTNGHANMNTQQKIRTPKRAVTAVILDAAKAPVPKSVTNRNHVPPSTPPFPLLRTIAYIAAGAAIPLYLILHGTVLP